MFKTVALALAAAVATADARSSPGSVLRLRSMDQGLVQEAVELETQFLAASFANITDFEPLFLVRQHPPPSAGRNLAVPLQVSVGLLPG
eukprot:scaffold1318_cov388-Prasinococcus_capsulatus_cf.AAC.11